MAIAAESLDGEVGDDGGASADVALPAPVSGVAQPVRVSASTEVSRNTERGHMGATIEGESRQDRWVSRTRDRLA